MAEEQIRLLAHNGQIVLLVNGRLTADFPPQVARQLAVALNAQAALIENDANPEKTINDQAILMRAGMKLGLTDNKKILKEAHKEAQWNGDLRRYMKGANAPGIKTKEIVGTPTVAVN